MKKLLLLQAKAIYSFISLLYVLLLVIRKKKNYALFISHDMSVSGAPIVLKRVVEKSRSQFGLVPIVVTLKPGELIADYLKIGIFPISTFYFEKPIKSLLFKIHDYRLIVVNTVVSYEWAFNLEQSKINYIWWIHEGDEYISKYYDKLPSTIVYGKIWFVSEYTRRCLYNKGVQYIGDIVPYYLPKNKVLLDKREECNDTKNIIIIGSICRRKNQLELLKACDLLPQSIKQKINVQIIGKAIENEYKKSILEYLISKNIKVTFTDFIPNSDIVNIYNNADVCVCCSTDDPLPVTVSEAILYGCPVVVSSNCGQYSLIEDGLNGYKYEQGDFNMLKKKIVEALNCDRTCIAKNGLKLYEKYFSEGAFDKSLEQEINTWVK